MNKNKNHDNNNTAQETYLSMSTGRHKRLKELPAKHKGNIITSYDRGRVVSN